MASISPLAASRIHSFVCSACIWIPRHTRRRLQVLEVVGRGSRMLLFSSLTARWSLQGCLENVVCWRWISAYSLDWVSWNFVRRPLLSLSVCRENNVLRVESPDARLELVKLNFQEKVPGNFRDNNNIMSADLAKKRKDKRKKKGNTIRFVFHCKLSNAGKVRCRFISFHFAYSLDYCTN